MDTYVNQTKLLVAKCADFVGGSACVDGLIRIVVGVESHSRLQEAGGRRALCVSDLNHDSVAYTYSSVLSGKVAGSEPPLLNNLTDLVLTPVNRTTHMVADEVADEVLGETSCSFDGVNGTVHDPESSLGLFPRDYLFAQPPVRARTHCEPLPLAGAARVCLGRQRGPGLLFAGACGSYFMKFLAVVLI